MNDFTESFPRFPASARTFVRVRRSHLLSILQELKVDSATGPDGIATRFLKRCSAQLARPLALLLRRMLANGQWPTCWRFHRLVPLHNRKARSNGDNYRGVHLTSQISKCVERAIDALLRPHFHRTNVFGKMQFAHSKGRGHRDALALMTLSWIRWLEQGQLVAIYCSDVSGAFDRIGQRRLGRKLSKFGPAPSA